MHLHHMLHYITLIADKRLKIQERRLLLRLCSRGCLFSFLFIYIISFRDNDNSVNKASLANTSHCISHNFILRNWAPAA